MGRPRKTKAKAGGAEASSPALSIGNCKVEIHGSGLRCVSTEQNLTISGARGAKILITVDGARSSSDGTGEGSDFILLNPNEADSLNKSLLQEVLRLYKKELPTMDYAADTGRKSGFLEKCIMNGKYKTLILRSISPGRPEEVSIKHH
ncbi:unnamed protein product [Triticum turgidum subsp. durum]|uniref:Uncharacterized protein n=1 Tax=Triticum turgidum subsp. durum TaxID=4567 RepID=A0A9R0QVU8_TRITD|nr:unnamed protein product [Triticum turgidum subsp. durum]